MSWSSAGARTWNSSSTQALPQLFAHVVKPFTTTSCNSVRSLPDARAEAMK